MTEDYHQLEKNLGHGFNNPAIIREALRHSSYVNEQPDDLRDNERLEFLGDAVLNLIIGDLLMRRFPELREGDLSLIRANLVNETQLADIARSISLGDHLLFGKGEIQTSGREKNSILANAMEAVIAAVYLDDGFESAYGVVQHHFRYLIESASDLSTVQDYKSRLQEAVQGTFKEMPAYQVVDESGPDHDKTFYVEVSVEDIQCRGEGKSKKAAEQDAAHKALEIIEFKKNHQKNPSD